MTRTKSTKRIATSDVGSSSVPAIAASTDSTTLAHSREFMDRIAAEVFRGVIVAIQGVLRGDVQTATTVKPGAPDPDVMNADEVAAFLGVDRTTVYDFAGRGVIPHQRLGKRLLFGRAALVSWLDSSLCKATSIRKG